MGLVVTLVINERIDIYLFFWKKRVGVEFQLGRSMKRWKIKQDHVRSSQPPDWTGTTLFPVPDRGRVTVTSLSDQ